MKRWQRFALSLIPFVVLGFTLDPILGLLGPKPEINGFQVAAFILLVLAAADISDRIEDNV